MPSLNRQLVFTGSTITVDGSSVGSSYVIPLGDPAQYFSELIGFFTISGTATLNTSLVITYSGTPAGPVRFTFLSRANIDLNGNTITIFGHSLTEYQAANPFVLDAFYDGTTWAVSIGQVEIQPTGLTNSQMSTMPAFTFKMNSGNTTLVPQDVTGAEVATLLNVEYDNIVFVLDFNSGYIPYGGSVRQDILIPYDGEVTRVFGYCTQDIATDNAVIDFGIAGSAGGGYSSFSTITFTGGSPANTFENDSSPATPDNSFNANNYLVAEASKATWGGRVIFTVVTKRTV